ncbi:MAG TPA: glycosyltransferase family 4 protein [Candidatus Thermoplasmatota archaeon]|nr:glycosyltransferase family 4 protein [Candidatus Thermoplasmatota archaeon]
MHVAQVCVRFGGPGGAEAHVKALAAGLARRGHRVTVVTTDLWTEIPWVRRDPSDFPPPPEGVEVVRVPALEGLPPLSRAPAFPGMFRALGALEDVDVIHAHSHRYFQLWPAAWVSHRRGIPLAVTPHYHPAEDHLPAWKRGLARVVDHAMAATVYARASRILTVTDREKDLLSFLPRGKMVTVPNGLDVARWRAPAPATPFATPYILYAGRLASNKGLATLIDAFAALAPARPGLRLVLVGEDWGERGRLEKRAADLGLADRVLFAGHLDEAGYRSAMAGAAVFALPSAWEAFGIVLLEAGMAGLPVVATAVGGVPDVVEEGVTGHLVPYGDAATLADRLGALVDDPVRAAAMGRAGAKRAEGFDWGAIVERLEGVYLAMLRES